MEQNNTNSAGANSNFWFSDKIKSKYLTFKIASYYSSGAQLYPLLLLSKKASNLFSTPMNKKILRKQQRKKLEASIENPPEIDFEQEIVTIESSTTDLQLNAVSHILKISYDTILLAFSEQTFLIAYCITTKRLQSLLALDQFAEIQKNKKGFGSLFFGSKSKHDYSVSALQTFLLNKKRIVVAQIQDQNHLLFIKYEKPSKPKFLKRVMVQRINMNNMIVLSPAQDSSFITLMTRSSEDTIIVIDVDNKLYNVQEHIFQMKLNLVKVKENEARLFKSDQSLCELKFTDLRKYLDLYEINQYERQNESLIGICSESLKIAVYNKQTKTLHEFNDIKIHRPSCLIDLNDKYFLATSQKFLHMFNKDKMESMNEFQGAPQMVNGLVKIDFNQDGKFSFVICDVNGSMKFNIWLITQEDKKFIGRIEVTNAIRCMTMISCNPSDKEAVIVAGLQQGNKLLLCNLKF